MELQGIRGRIVRDAPMKRYTSMRVGGPAAYLLYPRDAADVASAMACLAERDLPFRFLGNGTNVIVADRGPGVAIIRTSAMRHLRFTMTADGAIVRAGAGVGLAGLIRACAARGFSGLERLFGIPGTVGGAIRMNAGSFGAAVSDTLRSVTLVDGTGATCERAACSISFGYRGSSIGQGECIVRATFGLARADSAKIKADMEEVWRRRLERHPMDSPSAGSVFKNTGGPAWQQIDRAGLRGLTMGGAAVSEKHPNFIVNKGGASALDVRRLIDAVKKGVASATGVSLEEEVEMWGFDD